MFIALSERYPKVVENIASFSALGPVVYLTNIRNRVAKGLVPIMHAKALSLGYKLVGKAQQWIGHGKLMVPTTSTTTILSLIHI